MCESGGAPGSVEKVARIGDIKGCIGKNESVPYELCDGTGSPDGETTGGLASRGTGLSIRLVGEFGLVEYTDTLVATLFREDRRRISDFAGASRFGRFSVEA